MAFASSHRPHRPGAHRPLADINVTPLVDVMLVLLIVFMVTAPMLAAGLKVNLPQARTAQPLPPKEPIVVTVKAGGEVALGVDPIEREHLAGIVKARLDGDQSRVVQVKGDRDAPYGEVVGVIDLLSAGGIARIALVTDKAKRAPSAALLTSPTSTAAIPSPETAR
jgi:biopolymer transport protein ExbD